MTSRQTLERLLQLLQEAEAQEAARLRETNAAKAQEALKAQTLEGFRQEYEQRYLEAMAQARPAPLLANYRSFLQRLEEAVAVQQQVIARVTAEAEAQQQRWQQAVAKRKAMETLLARRDEMERQQAEKMAQKLLDEWVSIRQHPQHESPQGDQR